MPLDPQVQQLLDRYAALGIRPVNELTPAEARAQMTLRQVPPEARPSVARVFDRTIPGPAGPIPIRVYAAGEDTLLPVVAFFHGSGFVVGGLESHDAICRALARASGCLIASVDYRLAPEHPYPAAAEDCYAATQWIAENAAELGGDGTRLAAAGDSAGGNLAAVVPLMARDRSTPPIAFQLLIYPVLDHRFETPSYRENSTGYGLTREAMHWYWQQYLPDPAHGAEPYASPLRAEDLRGLPPALVITAEYDVLRDEGAAYAERLRAAGVPVQYSRYAGMNHGFFGAFLAVDRARDAVAEAGEALRAALAAPLAKPEPAGA
jgi:acetyl esterase